MIGIDEVGRGCWAGPLLVVAVRQRGQLPTEMDDSKKLSKRKREKLSLELQNYPCDIGEGWVTSAEIDSVGLSNAMRLGVSRALQAIDALPNESIIMDGAFNYCEDKYSSVRCIIKADALHPVVSAASIWAKVARDTYMSNQAKLYAGYGFEFHVGYGTSQHIDALKTLGTTPLHRLSYKPVRKIYETQ